MIVVRKQLIAGVVSTNTDEVFAFAPLPPGGKVISVSGELHVIGPENHPTRQFTGYGVSGYVEPLVDPDGAIAIDTLWDNMVTKPSTITQAAATSQVDWDFDSTTTGPDVEAGKMDLNRVMGLAAPGKVLMPPLLEMLSWAKSRQGGWHAEAAETDQFQLSDYKTFNIRSGLMAPKSMPAYGMLAISVPVFGVEEVSATVENAAHKWATYGNLRNAMGDFWRLQTGIVEGTAESPYAEISQTIEELVAPPIVMSSTAEIITTAVFTYMCNATWVLDFPDSFIPKTLAAHAG